MGINFIDTANQYGGHLGVGATEAILGKWLAQDRARRDKIVLASKVYEPMSDHINDRGLSARHIQMACDASLKRLQVDHIDLYQFHHIDRLASFDEIWQAADRLIAQGKVTYLGSSNFPGWKIAQANEQAAARHRLGLVSEQSLYNLIERRPAQHRTAAFGSAGTRTVPKQRNVGTAWRSVSTLRAGARSICLVTGTAQPGETWQRGQVVVSGGHLAYHRTGGGAQALVLAHGLTDNGLCWARTAQALQGQFDLIMLDARGHGASSRFVAGARYDPARDIAEAIAALGLTAPIVLGHSVGALAMSALAAAYPSLAAKVILEDPPWFAAPPSGDKAERQQRFQQQVADFAAMTDAELMALGQRTSPGWDAAEFPGWVLGKRQIDPAALPDWGAPWQETVVAITAPTLLIYGETARGGLVSAAVAAEATQLNQRLTVVQIEGAGHNVRRENFAGFLAQVRAFLGRGEN